jgi:hypothetical protein
MTRQAIQASIPQRLSKRLPTGAWWSRGRQILGGAHGYSQPGRITIFESLTPADTAAVLVHEFARELLHERADDRSASKTVRETEAEAVVFIVGTAIGIRSSVDATDYVGAVVMWLTSCRPWLWCESGPREAT